MVHSERVNIGDQSVQGPTLAQQEQTDSSICLLMTRREQSKHHQVEVSSSTVGVALPDGAGRAFLQDELSHTRHELIEVDLTRLVGVDLFEDSIQLLQ